MNNELALAADIVIAHVSHNTVAASDLPGLITDVHKALTGLTTASAPTIPALDPAVPIKASVKPDYIVCLEDGKKLKMLKRYLAAQYDMTPEQYRAKWRLPHDYPMVAPNYSDQRRHLAVKMGLGTKRAPEQAPAKKVRGRK